METENTEDAIEINPDDLKDTIPDKIDLLEYIKNFFLNYTLYNIKYIENNLLYFSYNFCDFYLEFNDKTNLYSRKYADSGDFVLVESYETTDLALVNEICNSVNRVEFLGI